MMLTPIQVTTWQIERDANANRGSANHEAGVENHASKRHAVVGVGGIGKVLWLQVDARHRGSLSSNGLA